jgi:hypothetical protein
VAYNLTDLMFIQSVRVLFSISASVPILFLKFWVACVPVEDVCPILYIRIHAYKYQTLNTARALT